MQGIFNSRNLVILVTLVVGMIIGASLAAYTKEDQGNVIEDAVNVVVPGNALLVSDQLRTGLRSLGAATAAIALVNDKGALQAVTSDGIPIALCGPSIPTCRLKISLSELIAQLTGLSKCLRCGDGQGFTHACEPSTNTYDCNDRSPTQCRTPSCGE